jgi:hypothetical protein
MGRTTVACAALLTLISCRRIPGPASGGTAPRSMPSGRASALAPPLSYADLVDRVAPAVIYDLGSSPGFGSQLKT